MTEPTIAVSFVHEYSDLDHNVGKEKLPALWIIDATGREIVHEYPFPRNVSDFLEWRDVISGSMPLASAQEFQRLPRFGLTGLAEDGEYLFAGSWNGVYVISKSDYKLERFVTNNLMNDMHGIWVDSEYIVTILTGKDTVVISNHDGVVINHFTISKDLSIYADINIEEMDWRFLSKQFRGATGIWHFNYVQKFGDEIWLTSRNISAFIIVNIKTRNAYIRSINHKTPVLLHDGVRYNGEYYFTSIDGKIVVASEASSASFDTRERIDNIGCFSRDMISWVIRLDETEFGREPNWCRGIECIDNVMYVTVDGRYDTDLSFGLLGLKRSGERVFERRLHWRDIGSEKDLRYVTGFDVIAL